jgi:hypothetical protein
VVPVPLGSILKMLAMFKHFQESIPGTVIREKEHFLF